MTANKQPEISIPLGRLAAVVRATALKEPLPPAQINKELVHLARRHRVSPMLYAASRRYGQDTDADSQDLIFDARMSAIRLASANHLLKNLALRFHAANFPWLNFKGPGLAQLYPEPSWRHMNDLDLLVPIDRFDEATQLLKECGHSVANTELDPDHWIERLAARLAKDVIFFEPKTRMAVELHHRLFFVRAEERRIPLLRDTFKPRVGRSEIDIPQPAPGAGLFLYLLVHGAVSRWFRLKWLADLAVLMPRLERSDFDAVSDAARDMKATVPIRAGLRLFGWLFGEDLIGHGTSWLSDPENDGAVTAQAQTFLKALERRNTSLPSREGDLLDSFAMYYAMSESRSYRASVVLRGSAWIAVRTLRRRWPRRTTLAP